MRSKLRSRLTFANVGVVIAIFFAVGGPSFAADAVSHAARLITGKQIKDSSITTKDIKNGSLLNADFKAGQLPSGPRGPAGGQGPKGETGQKGDTGPPGPTLGFTAPTGGCCDAGTFPTGDLFVAEKTVHVPFPARLFVPGSAQVVVQCSGTPCEADYEIAVDGTPLAGSEVKLLAAANQTRGPEYIHPVGMSEVLPAGDHQLKIARQLSGNPTLSSFSQTALEAIALGG